MHKARITDQVNSIIKQYFPGDEAKTQEALQACKDRLLNGAAVPQWLIDRYSNSKYGEVKFKREIRKSGTVSENSDVYDLFNSD